MQQTKTPYRVLVFAQGTKTTGRGKTRRTQQTGFGFVAWNPDHTVEVGRLPGSGSFVFPGIRRARIEAMYYLGMLGNTYHQVSIRTNQDREVYRYFKHADGRITGYGATS